MMLPKILERHRSRIAGISDERSFGDGYWVYLKAGWNVGGESLHIIHEDNPTQCAKAFAWVEKCKCNECRMILDKGDEAL